MESLPKNMLCISYDFMWYNGIWLGDNPLEFLMPRLMMQIILCSTFTATTEYFLKPFGQTSCISRLMGAMFLGTPVMGRLKVIQKIFSYKTLYILDTFQYLGFMLWLFILGLKMDMSMVKKSGSKALGIGFSCFIVPLFISIPFTFLLQKFVKMDQKLNESLIVIAIIESLSSFHVIASLLADLKLLNSELGRLAMSSSMISGVFSYGLMMLINTMKPYFFGQQKEAVYMGLCVWGGMILMFMFMRPTILWLIKTNPEGSIKELHMIIVFVMILTSAFFGEITGQHFLLGPMVLGVIFPVGPSFATEVQDRLHPLVYSLLLPLFYASCGGSMEVQNIHTRNFIIVQCVVLFAFLGKMIGTMLASLYCQMPFNDALLVGLILSSQGIVDIHFIRRALNTGIINGEIYSIMIILVVLLTGSITPLIKAFYNPSRRYMGYKKRTILHTKHNTELRIVTCVHNDEDVPNLINILEASNPARGNPICIFLIHLIELQGRANPIFISHSFRKNSFRSSSRPHRSQHIINAFRFFEQHNLGLVTVDPYTAISPFVTMHDDVCTLALEKKTSLIIVPFHRKRNVDGIVANANKIRMVNKNILRMAPCSVGILIDPKTNSTNPGFIWSGKSLYRVGVLFLGGSDDREALAYGIRMSEHCNVNVTLFRFVALGDKSVKLNDKRLDGEILDEFRDICRVNDRVEYKEVVVKDGVGTVSKIQSLQNSFDLLMVGRHHELESPLVSGLAEWNELPELGVIGDMLATTEWENHMLMLVVQQQFRALNLKDRSPNKKNHCITI